MRHYPQQVGDPALPDLDWPGSLEDMPATSQLYWVAPSCSEGRLASLSLHPNGQPVDGEPLGGTVLDAKADDPLVPVWLCERPDGSWWAVDGTNGMACGGLVHVSLAVSRARLAFFCGLALMLSFVGGSLVFWLLAITANVLPLVTGPESRGVVAVLCGALAIPWLTLRLNAVIPSLLAEPVERAQSGQVRLPVEPAWLGLLQAFSYLMGFAALMGVLGAVAAALQGTSSLGLLLSSILQSVLAGYLTWKCRLQARGRRFARVAAVASPGPLSRLVQLGLRIALFSIAGQQAGGLLALSGWLPHWEMPGLTLQGAQWGAVLGAATASLSRRERVALLAGLLAKTLGELWMGGWLALVLALLAVAAPGIAAALGAAGEDRRLLFVRACRESWAFTFALIAGRIAGRVLGVFFLGIGGLAVGEALAEQVAASAGLVYEQRRSL